VQISFGLRDTPISIRILLAIDHALPIAFLGALLGEAYAGTQGLGFVMVVASATYQTAYGLVGFFLTMALVLGLSSALRVITRRSCCLEGISSPRNVGCNSA
jgi:ABC-type nitrate/sulfonate/bicarbonate transport system permease component